MSHIRKFTPEKLKEMRQRSHESVFFFQRFLCGLKDMEDCHRPLSEFFQARHHFSVINAFRGFFKSSLGLTFLLWEALEHVNHEAMLQSQREKLAEELLERIVHIIDMKPLLVQVYADRFPPNREKWNVQRLSLLRTNPAAGHSIIVGSILGKQESRHVDHIYCDDLEGADADTSDIPNEESIVFVDERAIPLLNDPVKGRITVVGTPHGPRPLVLELEKRSDWNSFRLPLHDENMQPAFPQRFPKSFCEDLAARAKLDRRARKLYATQYLLKPWEDDTGGFEIDLIDSFNYEITKQGYLKYPAMNIDLWKKDPETGLPKTERVWRRVHLSNLRFYVHFDPKHRDRDEMKGNYRPTRSAILVVGISPDFHAFVVDTWIKDTGNMATQLLALTRNYELWNPKVVTYEAIGAQKWLKDQVQAEEKRGQRYQYQARWSKQRGKRLRRLSHAMEESAGANKNKEHFIVEQLETWFSMGWLHLGKDQHELREHVRLVLSNSHPIDGVDALSQGPSVWNPPRSVDERKVMEHRRLILEHMNPPMDHTGYRPLLAAPKVDIPSNFSR